MIDQILEKLGLKYEDLDTPGHKGERETLMMWLDELKKNPLTIERLKTYIASMRDSVEQELTKSDLNKNQDLYLKARLRNYMLLEAFLSTPEKAQKALEQAVAGLVVKK